MSGHLKVLSFCRTTWSNCRIEPMKLWAIRKIRANGKAAYLALPKIARLELGLFIGDNVTLELDTEQKTLTMRAAHAHKVAPQLHYLSPDMEPIVEHVVASPAADAPAARGTVTTIAREP